MLIMGSSGDIMDFRLQGNSFLYQLRLEGNTVDNVKAFQGYLVSPDKAHLCIFDIDEHLTYYQWQKGKWQLISTWQSVSASFQSSLDSTGQFHLVIPSTSESRFCSYQHRNETGSELHFLDPDTPLLQFYSIGEDKLFLFQKKILESACQIFYYSYHIPSKCWSEKMPLVTLPLDSYNLQLYLSQGMLQLTYNTPAGSKSQLNLLSINIGSGSIEESSLGKVSSSADPPVLAKVDNDLVLLALEANTLIYWRTSNGGQTWKTKAELPCPWPLKLAPVTNYQKEVTPYVALEGFYGIELRQAGLVTAKQLLSLSPYGLWL